MLLGLLGGFGLVLALSRLPMLRRPTLEDRLAPYLRDAPRPSRLLLNAPALTPFPTLERIAAPAIRDGVRVLERVLGATTSVRRRLEVAGRGMTVEQFRAEQLLWGGAALVAALTLSLFVVVRVPGRAIPALNTVIERAHDTDSEKFQAADATASSQWV